MFITSFLKAYRVLGRGDCRDFALASLDRILRECVLDGDLLHAEGVAALLDDHIHLTEALAAAYEATADRRYLDHAGEYMDRCLRQFGDQAGGFHDTEREVLGARLKGIEDIPHPSANGVAVQLLLKLYHLSGRREYRTAAEASLRLFVATVRELSVHAGTYYAGLDAWFRMVKLTVEADPGCDLAQAARRICGPATVILYGDDRGRVIPCVNETCADPVRSAPELARIVEDFSRGGALPGKKI